MLLDEQIVHSNSSNLLLPLHSIGLVTDDIEFSLEKIGDEYFIVVATGNHYQVYDLDQLRIKYISPRLRDKIDTLTTRYETVYLSMGRIVEGYSRFDKIFELNEHESKVKGILVLGQILVTWDRDSVIIFDIENKELIHKINLDLDLSDEIVKVLHPITYLNKIIIVTSRNCELWNINTKKMIYKFNSIQEMFVKNLCLNANSQNFNSKKNQIIITSAVCSNTHPDIIGIGTQNGVLYTLDIANDEILLSLEHLPEQKGITSMSFCTEKSILVSGCENGDLVVWDLENARVLNIVESAHESGIVKVEFVQGTSIFVTSGADNSIVEYIIDNQNSHPRELRSRRGHISSIKKSLFYNALPEKSRDLICISNSKNRGYLGKVSTIQQHQNRLFSQNSLKKKFNEKYTFPFRRVPPIIDISFAESRHFDWPNIVTIHEGMHEVFIWSGHNFALTPRLLTLENIFVSNNNKQSKFDSNYKVNNQGLTSKKRNLPTAIAISVSGCGNYVVVGYSNNTIHRFNLQSSIHSGEFFFNSDSGIHFQSLNILSINISQSALVLCISRDFNNYYLSTWSMKPIKSINTTIISKRVSSDENEPFVSKLFGYFIVLGFCNGKVLLYDFQSQVVSREFNCGSHSILDLTISSDNRWIVISTSNSELFIYDIISSNLLDWIKFSSPVVSCIFDHSDTFLITSHEKSNGALSIWANKHALSVSIEEGISKPPNKPFLIDNPPNKIIDSESSQDLKIEQTSVDSSKIVSQIELISSENGDLSENQKLISFSGIPFSTQQAILYIEEIKERNKPIQPPQKPESVPFFLPNTTDFSKAINNNSNIEKNETNKTNQQISKQVTSLKTELQQILQNISLNNTDSFINITKLLKSKSPSGVNLLLRQLGPLSGGSFDEITKMIHYFNFSISNRADSDLIQTYLNVFLTIHSMIIIENQSEFRDIKDQIQKLTNLVKKDWDSIQNRLQNISCFVKFATNIQMD